MIPSQLPAPVTIKPGLAPLLGLKPGQVFDAIVTGQNAAGATEVMVGKQQLALALQQALAPGTVLQMRLDTAAAGARLVVLAQTPPAAGQAGAEAAPVAVALPVVRRAALPQTLTPAATPPASVPALQAGVSQPGMQTALPQGPQATIIERQAGVPVRAMGPQAVPLQPGQVVAARVLGPGPAGQTQVRLGRQELSLSLSNPPPPGTMVQLRLEQTPVGQRLVMAPPEPGAGGDIERTGSPAPGQAAPRVAEAAPQAGTRLMQPAGSITPKNAPAPVLPAPPIVVSPPAALVRPMPKTEQAAVAQMVQTAAVRQDTTAPLMAALLGVVHNRAAMPAPVAQAIDQVLAARTSLDVPLDGVALQKAVLRSGVFQEAQLALGDPPQAARSDVKAALLALRDALAGWLGEGGPIVSPQVTRQPPVRGGTPRALREQTDIAPLGGPVEEIGKTLLERTDNALARLRLHQHASLPEQTVRVNAEWQLELPVIINQQQAVMQLQIARDGGGGGDAAAPERNWQMRFAVNLPSSGEVGAQVGLRGRRASVVLWAAEQGTADVLRGLAPQLARELAAAGLEPGPISVRSGTPAGPATGPSTGTLVDAVR